MDSQLTLVPVAPAVRLMFSKDSMKNATLFLDSVPIYVISTDAQNACTELRAAGSGGGELLARITRKEILPDAVAFPALNGGKEIRLAKWLKKSKLADGSSTHVINTFTVHGTFFLMAHPVHRLALFQEDDLQKPIAQWERVNGTGTSSPPIIVIEAGPWEVESLRPCIIAAFIVQEFKMRMKEQAGSVTLAMGRPAGQFVLMSAAK
ncbi:hypothetical protein MVEN_00733900 [Mycena venus]|uniref:DUF6593 domain-containing protein n=1 Tax=Mycena venus TaxID=2733690 RepID=A0A8H7D5Y8_9AGAR|nr:hypothetical protein MVEN_00733900 [Mycena venus]